MTRTMANCTNFQNDRGRITEGVFAKTAELYGFNVTKTDFDTDVYHHKDYEIKALKNINFNESIEKDKKLTLDVKTIKKLSVRDTVYPEKFTIVELQVQSEKKGNLPGWLYTTKSTHIGFLTPHCKSFLFVPVKELRYLVDSHRTNNYVDKFDGDTPYQMKRRFGYNKFTFEKLETFDVIMNVPFDDIRKLDGVIEMPIFSDISERFDNYMIKSFNEESLYYQNMNK